MSEDLKSFFESDLGEIFEDVPHDSIVDLPVSRLGFESLLNCVCSYAGVPVSDNARLLVCGYVHHIGREKCTSTIAELGSALRKQYANQLTTMIYDEIDQKRRAVLAAQTKPPTLVPDPVEVPTSNESA